MYQEILKKYEPTRDNLIYILHEIQNKHPQQYISEEAVEVVSEFLKIPTNHIYGVLTFYTMYSTKPRGKYIIRLCESPPCYLKGAVNIKNKLEEILQIKVGNTTTDGMFTLELCACLGLCGNAPVMMINEEFYGDLTDEKLKTIIEKLKAK